MTNHNGKTHNLIQSLPHTAPGQLQPHDFDAEEALLGALLIDHDAIIKVAPMLTPFDFFIQRHGWIFEAIRNLFNENKPADSVTMCNELVRLKRLGAVGGPAALTELTHRTPSSLNAEYYAGIVKEMSTRRQAINVAGEIARLAHNPEILPDELLSKSEKMILDIGGNGNGGIVFAKEIVEQEAEHIDRIYQNKNAITGVPSGLHDLDLLTGGFQNDELIIIGGRPGMGKSSLAMQVAKYNGQRFGKKSLIFSMEMSRAQYIQRMLAAESGIELNRLRTGKIQESEWPALVHAEEAIGKLPVAICDDVSISSQDMRSRAIRHAAQFGLDIIIVDYLQLIRADGNRGNRTEDVSEMSRSLKRLSRELHIPVLALSSLNRALESRADKRPMLSDLRESGSIESDADVVIFIYRDEIYNPDTEFPNIAEIIISKARSGPTGVFSAYFKKHLTTFVDLEIRRQSLEQVY